MALFTTRIELVNIDSRRWNDIYGILHTAMESEGFTKIIMSTAGASSGIRYYLPDAEYNLEGNFTDEQVLAKAHRAAKKTNEEYRIFISQAISRVWYNLKVVK